MRNIMTFKKGDYAEYITDYIGYGGRCMEGFTSARILTTHNVGYGILDGLKADEAYSIEHRFTNKGFVCVAVADHGTRLFLYLHDGDFYLYTLTPERG